MPTLDEIIDKLAADREAFHLVKASKTTTALALTEEFIGKLAALPEAQPVISKGEQLAETAVGGLVAGATPAPFGLITGPAASGVIALAFHAISSYFESKVPPPPARPAS